MALQISFPAINGFLSVESVIQKEHQTSIRIAHWNCKNPSDPITLNDCRFDATIYLSVLFGFFLLKFHPQNSKNPSEVHFLTFCPASICQPPSGPRGGCSRGSARYSLFFLLGQNQVSESPTTTRTTTTTKIIIITLGQDDPF